MSPRPIVSSFARSVRPSATLALTARAEALRLRGVDVIAFGAGQPDFGPDAGILEDVVAAVRAGCNRYTPTAGTPDLRQTIATCIRSERGAEINPEEVLVSTGAKQAVLEAVLTLAEPGSEVVFPSPYWVSYPEMIRMARAVPVPVPCDPDTGWRLDLDAFEGALSERTSLVVLNTPCNPTGAVFPEEDVLRILQMTRERGIGVVSDEIYERLVYDGAVRAPSILDAPAALRERAVCVNGISKTFGMTGWRIGWAVGPTEIVAAMERIQDHSTSNPSTPAQIAARSALTRPQDWIGAHLRSLDDRRRLLLRRVREIPDVETAEPLGAFYAFPRIDGLFGRRSPGGAEIRDSSGFCEALLQEAHVAALPGGPFGEERAMRISYCVAAELLEEGLGRIDRFVRSLRADG